MLFAVSTLARVEPISYLRNKRDLRVMLLPLVLLPAWVRLAFYRFVSE